MVRSCQRESRCVLGVLAAALLCACLERELKPLNPCLVSGVAAEVAVDKIDKVDMLFMVDDSGSMKEEQASLRREFLSLIRTLTTGVRRDGSTFPPAKDLHLGVVSSDLGLVGIDGVDRCTGRGEDGVMQNQPSPELSGCQPSYPRFLSYRADRDDAERTALDFQCIASLGTEGCGYEQQLEAALKALWPSVDIDPRTGQPWVDPMTGAPGNRITFLGDAQGFGQLGQGDTANAGFLRNDESKGLSLIAIVMVTDEEDCSSAQTWHFTPARLLPADDPLAQQPPNLRCFHNKQNLYPLMRYVDGYKALRPGRENLVVFAVIAGVPQDLVEPADYAAIDWKNDAQREAFYANLLADSRMQEVPEPSTAGEADHNLTPSCTSYNADGSERTKAYPPRRLVEVARGFGRNGTVHSICQEDLGPAIDAIIGIIGDELGSVCLPRPLVRDADGLVGCNVVWELPPPAMARPGTPTRCQEPGFPWLLPPDAGRESVNERGGQVCKVAQMRVVDGVVEATEAITPAGVTTFGDGWYYDDFTDGERLACRGDTKQRVAFTETARPPNGVIVKLECLNETQSLPQHRSDVDVGRRQPSVGDRCDRVVLASGEVLSGHAACAVHLASGEVDGSMFCHPELNVCVESCISAAADCPPAWVCDDRPETLAATAEPGFENGRAFCVNPTCGGAE